MRILPTKATPTVRTHIDDTANDLEFISNTNETEESNDSGLDGAVGGDDTNDTTPEVDGGAEDDSWLDDLTPYLSEQAVTEQTTTQEDTTPEDAGTEDQQKRLAALYANLEHVDEDVAQELDNKLLAPLRAEINELKALKKQEDKYRQQQLIASANEKIFAKYPKAEKILKSQQFKDFINADSDPYSSEKAFDRVMRAYYAGDGAYVVQRLDAFVNSRGKPKPPVGLEPSQGSGGSGVGKVQKKAPMTDAEYLAKRRAIRAAPRGTYPPNALKKLAEEYQKSRG